MKWKIGRTTLDVLPPVKRYMITDISTIDVAMASFLLSAAVAFIVAESIFLPVL